MKSMTKKLNSLKQFSSATKLKQILAANNNYSKDSSDWFSKLIDVMEANDEALRSNKDVIILLELLQKAPTKNSLKQVITHLKKLRADFPKELFTFIKNIENGKYKSEFKKFEGNYSLISELFSLMKQALTY